MKLIVATKELQGQRRNDYCWATEGEPVTFGMECDGESVDGRCGCKRAMVGCTSSKATTTLKVVESELTPEAHDKVVYDHLNDAGWFKMEPDNAKNVAWAARDGAELRRMAAFFKVGDILEKRGGSFRLRWRPGMPPPVFPKPKKAPPAAPEVRP